MQVRPWGQKKPSQHAWQFLVLSGILLLSLLLGTGSGSMAQAHPGSQPCTQEDRLQFMFVFRKRFFSPSLSYRLEK
uniref:Uncharacterized protein n=1 Tax=Arundo donax TaxID=35708 RepID=A0A0A9BF81_ARUDO